MTEVTIYTRAFCGYCAVAFVEHDATYSPELRQEMIARAGGRSTFPQIFIGSTHVGGCDDLHALEREGRLDVLLAGA
jgi:glutaredoxin 3